MPLNLPFIAGQSEDPKQYEIFRAIQQGALKSQDIVGVAPITVTRAQTGPGTPVNVGVDLTAAIASIGAPFVRRDGTTPLTGTWNYGKNFAINGRNSTAWINISAFATGGDGSVGNPWTGWDTAITWTKNTRYYAPSGFYSYATSPNFGLSGLTLEGDGFGGYDGTAFYGTAFICTGTGDIMTVDGSASGNVKGVTMRNFSFYGNAASANQGLHLKSLVKCVFENLRCAGSNGAGFYIENVQQSNFSSLICSGSSEWNAYIGKTPSYGIYLANGASACTTDTFDLVDIAGTTTAGIFIESATFNCMFDGGAIQSNTGRGISNAGYLNVFDNIDFEANTGTDDILLTTGSENVQIRNCRVVSTGVTNAVTINPGAGRSNNIIVGGHYQQPIVISSGTGNAVVGQARVNGGITDSGTNTEADYYDLPTNKSVLYTRLGQPRSDATNSAVQSINNATLTALTFDTNTSDFGGVHSTSTNPTRFTVPTNYGGWWIANAQYECTSNAGTLRIIDVFKNGTTRLAYVDQANLAGGNATSIQVTWQGTLAAGDYIEFRVYQDTGGALNTTAGVGHTFGSLAKLY